MKKIEIIMDRGVIEARYDDGDVLRGGDDTAFLGKLEINQEAHSNYMPADQIAGFLDSVVLPQLNLFSRQLETDAIVEEEKLLEELAEKEKDKLTTDPVGGDLGT